MTEPEITLHLSRRDVSVLAASMGMFVTSTHGRMSYETRVALENVCRQAGIDPNSMCVPYEEDKRGRKWWKR
jgi:hypothetical protein